MNKEELQIILEKHKKWLRGEPEGEGADLRGAYLVGADLERADLRGANLRGADLRGADLRGADLVGANLRGANLERADLVGANLRGANLERADLDYSCFPLWCGGLDVQIDDRIAIQLLYHLVSNVAFSKNTSEIVKQTICSKELVALANQFHREDVPRIEIQEEGEE